LEIRPQFVPKAATPRATVDHQCKRVCVLNEAQAERVEYCGENFPCQGANHRHYTRAVVERMVDRGQAQWVGKGRNVATFVKSKMWQPMMSGGTNVMQMIPGGAF